jgi:acyl-CoA-binding protein
MSVHALLSSSSPAANSKLVIAVLATASVGALSFWFLRQRQRQQKLHEKQQKHTTVTTIKRIPIESVNRTTLINDETLWQSFEDAAAAIRTVKNLHNGDQLILYGLYKQVVVGDAPNDRLEKKYISSSTLNIMAEQAKFAAWADLRGMAPIVALRHYVAAVAEFMKEAPTTGTAEADDDDISSSADGGGDDYGLGPGFAAVSRPVDLQYADPHVNDGSLGSLLLQHATDHAALQKLLSSSSGTTETSINHADSSGQTALHLAADAGNLSCVKLLVEHGANVNAADRDGISILQAAVIAGHADTVIYLLQKGADPDQADRDGDTPRSCAVDLPMRSLLESATTAPVT